MENEKRDRVVSIRLTQNQHYKLRLAAKQANTTVADWARTQIIASLIGRTMSAIEFFEESSLEEDGGLGLMNYKGAIDALLLIGLMGEMVTPDQIAEADLEQRRSYAAQIIAEILK